jgi:hypothetical protein
MARLEYFVVSESISVDVNHNTVSLFHILNGMQLFEFPGSIPRLAVASAWVFDDPEIERKQEFQIRFEIRVPGARAPKIFRANMVAESRFENLHVEIQNVPVEGAGDIVFEVYLDDERQASHLLVVSRITD